MNPPSPVIRMEGDTSSTVSLMIRSELTSSTIDDIGLINTSNACGKEDTLPITLLSESQVEKTAITGRDNLMNDIPESGGSGIQVFVAPNVCPTYSSSYANRGSMCPTGNSAPEPEYIVASGSADLGAEPKIEPTTSSTTEDISDAQVALHDDTTFRERKKFSCPFCDETFNFSTYLTKHVYRVHRDSLDTQPRVGIKKCKFSSMNPASVSNNFSAIELKESLSSINSFKLESCSGTASYSVRVIKDPKTSRKSLNVVQVSDSGGSLKLDKTITKQTVPKKHVCPGCRTGFRSMTWLNKHFQKCSILTHFKGTTDSLPSSTNMLSPLPDVVGQESPISEHSSSLVAVNERKEMDCPECDRKFKYPSWLKRHIQQEHRRKSVPRNVQYAGDVIEMGDAIAWDNEREIETTVPSLDTSNFPNSQIDDIDVLQDFPIYRKCELACLLCKACFHSAKWLVRHLHQKHNLEANKASKCVSCSVSFENISDLCKHLDLNHWKTTNNTEVVGETIIDDGEQHLLEQNEIMQDANSYWSARIEEEGYQVFECPHCMFASQTLRGMRIHITLKHCTGSEGMLENYVDAMDSDYKASTVSSPLNSEDRGGHLEEVNSGAIRDVGAMSKTSYVISQSISAERKKKKVKRNSVEINWNRGRPVCPLCRRKFKRRQTFVVHMRKRHGVQLKGKYIRKKATSSRRAAVTVQQRTAKEVVSIQGKRNTNNSMSSSISSTILQKCQFCSFTSEHSKGIEIHILVEHTQMSSFSDANAIMDSSSVTSSSSAADTPKSEMHLSSSQSSPSTHARSSLLVKASKEQELLCPFCDFSSTMKRALSAHLRLKHGRNFLQRAETLMESSRNAHILESMRANASLYDNFPTSQKQIVQPSTSSIEKSSTSDFSAIESTSSELEPKKDAPQGIYTCEHCPYVGKSMRSLLAHKQSHRNRKKAVFFCHYCSFWTTRQIKLKQHMKIHPKKGNKLSSKLTPEVFHNYSKQSVDKSRRPRTSWKPTKRDMRQQEDFMNSSSYLNSESEVLQEQSLDMLIQNDVSGSRRFKTFCCDKCPASFGNLSSLNKHRRLHGSNFAYACSYCDYRAPFKPHLNNHMRTHEGLGEAKVDSMLITVPNTSSSTSLETTDPPTMRLSGVSCKQGPASSSTKRQMTSSKAEKNRTVLQRFHRLNGIVPSKPLSSPDRTENISSIHDNVSDSNQCTCVTCPKHGHADGVFVPVRLLDMNNANLNTASSSHVNLLQSPDFPPSSSQSLHKCHMCPYTSSVKEDVQVHMWRHGSRENYRCMFCNFSTSYPRVLHEHAKLHLQPRANIQPHSYMYFGECQIWKNNPSGCRELLFSNNTMTENTS